MLLKKAYKNVRLCICLLSAFVILCMNGCCSARYSYYLYHTKGEAALKSKDYKKAQNYYSAIYKNESQTEPVKTDRTRWAFYRLGVIAELTNDMNRARGYYWGDAVDEGFYECEKLIGWYAQAGWIQMDEKKKSRTLEEILDFEKTEPPLDNEEKPVERKKEIIVQKRKSITVRTGNNSKGEITATYNRSKTPPPENVPAPFKVYY